MSRKVWAAVACLIVVALGVGGILLNGDIYNPDSAIYRLVEQITPRAEVARAEAYSDMMRRQDIRGLERASDPEMLKPDFYAAVPKIAGFYPKSVPTSTGVVQYRLFANTEGKKTATTIINHRYADGSAVFTETVVDLADGKVQTFNLRKLTRADLRLLYVDPATANGAQWLMLGLAAGLFGFTLLTLYHCLAAPDVKWKWLWFIFITAGIGSLQFNWMTQVISVAAIDLRWGAGGYFQNLFQPVVIYLNAPVGAVIYWLVRRFRAG